MSCNAINLIGATLDCGKNVGGLAAIYVTDIQNVLSVGELAGEITGLTMASGTTFKTYNFRKGNGTMTPAGTRTDAAGTIYYTTVVEVKFNKMTSALRTELTAIAEGNTLVIAKDNNGIYHLIGHSNLDTYVYGVVSGASGAAYADPNQFTLTLTSETPDLPKIFASGFSFASIIS